MNTPGMMLPLETPSLLLRPAVPNDAGELLVLSQEPGYRTWLPSQVYDDDAQARSVLDLLIREFAHPADPRQGAYVLMVEHRTDRTLIGHVGLSPFDDDVEIGFAIAERYQGRGLAVEAIVAMSRWAFATFHLERILGIAAQENIASRRALVRAGYLHLEDRLMTFQGTDQPVSFHVMTPDPSE